jgi:hypothetical protein
MNTESFPSLPEQGKNLAKFTFDVVKNVIDISATPVLVSEEKQEERMSICKKCSPRTITHKGLNVNPPSQNVTGSS